MLDKNNMLYNIKWNNLNQIINWTDCKTVDCIQNTISSLIDLLSKNNTRKKHLKLFTPLVTDHNKISATIDISKPKYIY